MKSDFKIAIIVTIVAICTALNSSYGQFNQPILSSNVCGITNSTVTTIGIGNFTSSPLSALHVNSNLIPNSSIFNIGEVFRTDGPSNVLNSWRLWTGGQTDVSTPSEKGMIFCYGANSVHPEDTLNFSIQASTRDMTFHTMPLMPYTVIAKERMRIVGPQRWVNSSNYISREGNVGIGTISVFKTRKAKPAIADSGIVVTTIGKGIILNAGIDKNYFSNKF